MIYSRKNLVINPAGPNIILSMPLTNGNVLVYDATLGSYVNNDSENLVQASNIGNGLPVFKEKDGLELKFNTLAEGTNIILTESGGEIIISASLPSGTSSIVTIANTIEDRNALIPSLQIGEQVFVNDTGEGENALYLWNGSEFKTISTQDSAETDAHTISYTLTPSSPSSSLIGRISPTSRVTLVTVQVIIPFDGVGASLSIGDDNLGSESIMCADLNDLSQIGNYVSTTSIIFGGSNETEIKAFFAPESSLVGVAQVLVTYV